MNQAIKKKIVVIGPGAIVIGQAAEFDYSGSQCLQLIKSKGYEAIICNPNPATVMTDEAMADRIYFEPLTATFLKTILLKEKPWGVMGSFGGQTALNLTRQLARDGFFERHQIKVLGPSEETISLAEDRELFKQKMQELNYRVPRSFLAKDAEAKTLQSCSEMGFPLILRVAFTLGGQGGGIVYNEKELPSKLEFALKSSPNHQCLVEESILGLTEIEFEVMRDEAGSVMSVCSMENIDPVGIHTGDSMVITPILTLRDREIQRLRSAALHIASELKVIGGCNVQLAYNKNNGELFVIEVNPRVSRSSALASKATGYPIAQIAAALCKRDMLCEVINPVTQHSSAGMEPTIDYLALKLPRFPFDKFIHADRRLGTQMKATGEILALERNLENVLLKGLRCLELPGVSELKHPESEARSDEELIDFLRYPRDTRVFDLLSFFRRRSPKGNRQQVISQAQEYTKIDPLFLNALFNLATDPSYINKNLAQGVKFIDTCSGEFTSQTPYFYLTEEPWIETPAKTKPAHEKKKVLIVGSGPIRIGQGIEFDYSSVHALLAAKTLGATTVMVNSNPETCSTDVNFSDKLYLSGSDLPSILRIIELERPTGLLLQFGGQTAIQVAKELVAHPEYEKLILGTSRHTIELMEDRDLFEQELEKLKVLRPKGKALKSSDINNAAQLTLHLSELKFPVMIRPSFVLGGRQMSISYQLTDAIRDIQQLAAQASCQLPILVDEYIEGKEVDVDVLTDGTHCCIPGLMEHIERAGVHSGDSMAVYPPRHIALTEQQEIIRLCYQLATHFRVVGLFNLQLTIKRGEVYLLEVNPRSSRTVPYISKMTNIPMAQLATELCLGQSWKDLAQRHPLLVDGLCPTPNWWSVKVPVFSFEKLSSLDPNLGPEMKSTGEVLGQDRNFSKALMKGLISQGMRIVKEGGVLFTISDRYKSETLPLAKKLLAQGFELYCTEGTAAYLRSQGIESTIEVKAKSKNQYFPTIASLIEAQKIDLVINTLSASADSQRDGLLIRRMAIEKKIPCFTSLDTANAYIDMLLEMNVQLFNQDLY